MAVVVVDPGHGGRDPGAIGKRLREKDVNLRAGLLLREALVRAGVTVLMTREQDTERVPGVTVEVDLKARAMLANTHQADLYVSWHNDVSTDKNVHGVAVWIHPSQRDQPTYHKAELMAQMIAESSGQKNRGVYYGDFQVLRDTMMDAVLVEGGFLTNSAEEDRLLDESFLRCQAEGAAKAICRVLGVVYVEPVHAAASEASDALGGEPQTWEVPAHLVNLRLNGSPLKEFGRLINGQTYVPVRELAERLGCAVQWDGASHTVSLTKGM